MNFGLRKQMGTNGMYWAIGGHEGYGHINVHDFLIGRCGLA
jgi:hypothetical protein